MKSNFRSTVNLSRSAFSVSHLQMRYVIFFSALIPLCFSGCADKSKQTKLKPGTTFEIHTVAAQQGKNTRSLPDPDSGAMLNLVDPPVITAANVDTAAVTTDENGNVILSVNIDNSGAGKLQAATAVPGNRIALVVNGRIASAPIVHAQVGSQFQVTGSKSMPDWQQVLQ